MFFREEISTGAGRSARAILASLLVPSPRRSRRFIFAFFVILVKSIRITHGEEMIRAAPDGAARGRDGRRWREASLWVPKEGSRGCSRGSWFSRPAVVSYFRASLFTRQKERALLIYPRKDLFLARKEGRDVPDKRKVNIWMEIETIGAYIQWEQRWRDGGMRDAARCVAVPTRFAITFRQRQCVPSAATLALIPIQR